MNKTNLAKIINAINKKEWWRTFLPNKEEIKKRGVFFTSSFKQAEFYGRPLDAPFKVVIKNPYISTPSKLDKDILGKILNEDGQIIKERFDNDTKIKSILSAKGYDSIIIVPDNYISKLFDTGKLPKSIELNIFSENQIKQLSE